MVKFGVIGLGLGSREFQKKKLGCQWDLKLKYLMDGWIDRSSCVSEWVRVTAEMVGQGIGLDSVPVYTQRFHFPFSFFYNFFVFFNFFFVLVIWTIYLLFC